ncbi:MAG TPA: long-chain fatty acid--CoA ligase [Spirochaetia bacterium]|nr:long-chain fatty acid--CoA ligase [Spirochaetia bacterium]
MNLVELADENYREFGEYPVVVFEEREYTNLQMLVYARKLANGLRGLGIGPGPGDRVVVLLLNCPEVLISYQGILRAGGIIVPVMFRLEAGEIAHILDNSGAAAIITGKDLVPKVDAARKDISSLRHIVIIEDDQVPGTVNFWPLIAASPDDPIPVDIKEDDLAVILYTAGTTGTPKGVMLLHRNLYSNAVSSAAAGDPETRRGNGLCILPLAHSFGLTVMNIMYKYGNLTVMMRWFDIEEVFRLIEKYKVRGFAGVPAMFAMMLNSPAAGKYDLSSLKACASGSAPLPVEVLMAFEKKFNCTVREGYGLSEAAPVVSTQFYNRVKKPGSIGTPIDEVDVRIVDGNDRDLPVGEIGELIVRGPNISPGYYKLPGETAETFKNGWLYTGDMAKMDEDGCLYIVERKKDLVIRGGFNIYPRDIEEVLHKHPGVLDAAVIGVPDPVMGEEVEAFIVLREGCEAGEQELLAHCRQYLAKFKCPRRINFTSLIPRNAIGKILRKELRRLRSEGNP